MKARLLFLFLCLTWNGWADTFVPYNPDSLKKGDWITLEAVHYYPYIAPGIKEEIPWRAENIRRITIQATVAEKTDHADQREKAQHDEPGTPQAAGAGDGELPVRG